MKEIFSRMDIQQIRAFLLNGEETCEIENAAGDLYEALTAYEKCILK